MEIIEINDNMLAALHLQAAASERKHITMTSERLLRIILYVC